MNQKNFAERYIGVIFSIIIIVKRYKFVSLDDLRLGILSAYNPG